MYKKIIFILLTMLFMSGTCDLGGKKSSISSTKAQTTSKTNKSIKTNLTTIDTKTIYTKTINTTTIRLVDTYVDTYKDAIKFNDLQFTIGIPHLFAMQVESVDIHTTAAALRVANITKLSEAKSMRDQAKLNKLIKSLTFTFKTESVKNKFTIISDYENLKIIYDGLRKDKDDPSLKPKLNINGEDVVFKDGYKCKLRLSSHFLGDYTDTSGNNSNFIKIYFHDNDKPKMIAFLGDILSINGIANFKKYLP